MPSDPNRPHQTLLIPLDLGSATQYDRSVFPLMKVKAKTPLVKVDMVLEATLDEIYKIREMVGNEENFQRLIRNAKAQYDS